jgi:hypothetical protein
MENFKTLKLSTLLDIHSDFTDFFKITPLTVFKAQEFEDLKKIILLVKCEIERRQHPKSQSTFLRPLCK